MNTVDQPGQGEKHTTNGFKSAAHAVHGPTETVHAPADHKSNAQSIASMVQSASLAVNTARLTGSGVIETLEQLAAVYNSVRATASQGLLERLGFRRRSSAAAIGAGFAAGAVLGAAGGFLFAPMSGTLLRKKLYSSAQSLLGGKKQEPSGEPANAIGSVHVAASAKNQLSSTS